MEGLYYYSVSFYNNGEHETLLFTWTPLWLRTRAFFLCCLDPSYVSCRFSLSKMFLLAEIEDDMINYCRYIIFGSLSNWKWNVNRTTSVNGERTRVLDYAVPGLHKYHPNQISKKKIIRLAKYFIDKKEHNSKVGQWKQRVISSAVLLFFNYIV